MINKTFHYCWFGGKAKPTEIKNCISSWQNFHPNFKIIEWNEKNYRDEQGWDNDRADQFRAAGEIFQELKEKDGAEQIGSAPEGGGQRS